MAAAKKPNYAIGTWFGKDKEGAVHKLILTEKTPVKDVESFLEKCNHPDSAGLKKAVQSPTDLASLGTKRSGKKAAESEDQETKKEKAKK